MIILLLTLSLLTYWSLRLMQRAVNQREFSLMFAGALVAVAGGGIIAAYTLMVGCMGYLGHVSYTPLPASLTAAYANDAWVPYVDEAGNTTIPTQLLESPSVSPERLGRAPIKRLNIHL